MRPRIESYSGTLAETYRQPNPFADAASRTDLRQYWRDGNDRSVLLEYRRLSRHLFDRRLRVQRRQQPRGGGLQLSGRILLRRRSLYFDRNAGTHVRSDSPGGQNLYQYGRIRRRRILL